MSDLDELIEEIVAFRDERDWAQFHTPAQLAAALSIEAAELQELFLWKDRDDIAESFEGSRLHGETAKEIADILIFALLFSRALDIDPGDVLREKLQLNSERYPLDLSKGKATTYSDLDNQRHS